MVVEGFSVDLSREKEVPENRDCREKKMGEGKNLLPFQYKGRCRKERWTHPKCASSGIARVPVPCDNFSSLVFTLTPTLDTENG